MSLCLQAMPVHGEEAEDVLMILKVALHAIAPKSLLFSSSHLMTPQNLIWQPALSTPAKR